MEAGVGLVARCDLQFSAFLHAARTPMVSRVMWAATVLSDVRVATVLATAVVLLLVVWGRRLDALFVTVSVGGGALLSGLAKALFERARPPVDGALIRMPGSFSFPSGHALNSLLLLGCLMLIVMPIVRGSGWKWVIPGACTGLVVLSGVSRVYLGVHWASDVVASWMLGMVWLSVCLGGYLEMRGRAGTHRYEPLLAPRSRILLSCIAGLIVIAVLITGARANPLLDAARATPGVRVGDGSSGS